jgi:hypothetical protein
MALNKEVERTCKKAAVARLNTLSQHFSLERLKKRIISIPVENQTEHLPNIKSE